LKIYRVSGCEPCYPAGKHKTQHLEVRMVSWALSVQTGIGDMPRISSQPDTPLSTAQVSVAGVSDNTARGRFNPGLRSGSNPGPGMGLAPLGEKDVNHHRNA
jgi:hypothetical protein